MSRLFGNLVVAGVACAVLGITPALAQAQQRHEGVGVGVKGGLLYSTLKFSDASDVFEGKAGWMGGIFFGGNRPGTLGLMGELNVLKKTTSCSGCGNDDLTLYYLQVPVLLRLNAGTNSLSGVNVYAILGPAIDVKIGEDLGGFNLVNEFEGFDISLVGGVGVEITRIILEARGTWGFRNIAKNLTGSQKITSKTFAVLVGFRFN